MLHSSHGISAIGAEKDAGHLALNRRTSVLLACNEREPSWGG